MLAENVAPRTGAHVLPGVGQAYVHLGGSHIVSDSVRLCGGDRYTMKITAPIVGVEAVLQEDPEAISALRAAQRREGGIGIWRDSQI
jgi:hypothetical protein